MAQLEGRGLTWKKRTPNSRSRVEVADAPNDDENDGLSTRFAGHIPHHIAMMPIGDEDRTELDSHVCAVFPSHTVLQGRCELRSRNFIDNPIMRMNGIEGSD